MFANDICKSRRGFTMIEVVVAILIICVLIALLIPAVRYAREESRRLSCVNNLKQVGTALSNYESVHKVYPQGINGQFFSAHAMILPYLEQASLYNSMNFSISVPLGSFSDGGANETVGKTILTAFCCPSDPDAVKEASTNYAWNGGLGFQVKNFVGAFASGATSGTSYIGSSSITDGLSNTSSMTEWKIGHADSTDDTTVVFNVNRNGSESYLTFVQKCESATRKTTNFGSWTKDADWVKGFYGSSMMNFNSMPNTLSCYYENSIDFGNWPASSYHNEGVNVLFFDNHVNYYKNYTHYNVWKSISTKSSNDIIRDEN